MESEPGRIVTLDPSSYRDWPGLRAQLETAAHEARVAVLTFSGKSTPAVPDEDLRWLELLPLPLVGAVAGKVADGAAVLALACDIRVAGPDASFALRPAGTARALALLGQRGVLEVARRGGELDARAALDLGLVSRLAEDGDVGGLAARVAEAIAARGPIATRLAKEAIWRGLPQPLEQALRFETDLTLLLQSTQDRAEGVRAFIEKRAPNFTGK